MRSSSGPVGTATRSWTRFGQLGQLLPAIAILGQHAVEQPQAALLVGAPLGQQLAHLAHLRAQLEQVERHQVVSSVRQPRSEPTSARWRTSLSSISFRPSVGGPLQARDLAVVDAAL